MNILRKIVLVLAVTLLPLALFGFGLSWSLHEVFGTPTHIERALTKSGIYHSIVGNALTQAQNKQQAQPDPGNTNGDNNVPFNQPAIRKVIEQAFPPEFLQTQTNGILDNVYGWLQGKKPNLGFTIDLTSAKTSLANGLGEYVQNQLSSLPACDAAQLPNGGDVDPFTATCVPKGFDISAAADKAKGNILNGDFLKDTQITASTIKNDKGQTLQDQLQKGPQIYHRVTLAIYALGGLAALLSLATVFLSATWRNGIRKLGSVYISVGAVSALLAWGISFGLSKASTALAKNSTANRALQQSVLDVAKLIAKDLQHYWLTYGIVLLALGIIGLVILMIMRPRHVVPKAPNEPGLPEKPLAAAAPAAGTPAPTPVPPKPVRPPRTKPRIVQG